VAVTGTVAEAVAVTGTVTVTEAVAVGPGLWWPGPGRSQGWVRRQRIARMESSRPGRV